MKDLNSWSVIARCNSSGPLYTFAAPTSVPCSLVAAAPSVTWHRRLGHPGHEALSKLASTSAISCNKIASDSLCHACQVGRHIRLPFGTSSSRALKNFDLVHCDLWTSPITSVSGYKYYPVILDDCSHFLWTFPLRLKSETFPTLANFFSYVKTRSVAPSRAFSVTMVASSITPRHAPFSSPMASCSGCRARTRLLKMVKPSV